MTNVSYISEINLPSKSGYAHHVLKICDAFSKSYKTKLYVNSSNINFSSLKKNYLLKKNFQIIHHKKKRKNNFISRITFVLFILNNIDKNSLIISRSVLSSLFLSALNIKNILELHHPPTGLTKIIFVIFRFMGMDKNLKYIFLHKNLKKLMSMNKGIILDDSVDINDFKKKIIKIKYEYCYVGSLFKGKGLEIIYELALKFTKKKFHVFGDLNSIDYKTFSIERLRKVPNLYLHNFKTYSHIPSILKSSKILLMPYLNNVNVNSENLEVSRYMSPLKMFDYLASGKIIFASNLKVYNHVLKHGNNSFIVKKNDLNGWFSLINNFLYKKQLVKKISRNAIMTASNYTWEKRVKKIISYYQQK